MKRKTFLKRILAAVICLIMAVSVCTPVFALSEKTEQYAKQAAVAGIKKIAGEIPFVGDGVSDIIGGYFSSLFGLPNDHAEVMQKLDEIYDAIMNIDTKLDEQQERLFSEIHQQKITSFNNEFNTLKGTVDGLYTRLKEIEGEYGEKIQGTSSNALDPMQMEKQIAIATLIESNNFDNTSAISSQLIKLTDYICGSQFSNEKETGMYELVYKANCKNSLLGCEAALKSSAYVNSLSRYMEIAFDTVFAISAAKNYVYENINDINNAMKDGTVAKCDLTGYTKYAYDNINSAVFGISKTSVTNKTSLVYYYNKLFDETNKESAISTYNSMLENVWFSYIDGTDYTKKPIEITYIPLNSKIGFAAPVNIGYNDELLKDTRGLGRAWLQPYSYSVNDNIENANKKALSLSHSALNGDQIDRLMRHFANSSIFGTDREDLSYIQVLHKLGFDFGDYDAYVMQQKKEKGMIGTTLRDPDMPKAQVDGMTKIMPTDTSVLWGKKIFDIKSKNQYRDMYPDTPDGWIGGFVDGYFLADNVDTSEPIISVQVARAKYSEDDGEVLRDDSVIFLYFDKPDDSTLTGSLFGGLSSWTIPFICVCAAAVIAVLTVVFLKRKKKQKEVTLAK